jgi:hypothetical protein
MIMANSCALIDVDLVMTGSSDIVNLSPLQFLIIPKILDRKYFLLFRDHLKDLVERWTAMPHFRDKLVTA